MGRKKKVIKPSVKEEVIEVELPIAVISQAIAPLSIDYPAEYLNDMARKINEIIARI